MKFAALILFTVTSYVLAGSGASAQDSAAPADSQSRQLTESGKTSIDGLTLQIPMNAGHGDRSSDVGLCPVIGIVFQIGLVS